MRQSARMTFLIVDDEPSLREIMAEFLEMSGHKVLCASGGFDALAILAKGTVDFVISDVRMPHGDGEYLLRELRKNDPKIPPVILVSGFSELTRAKAIELGAVDILQKPISYENLETLYTAVLGS